MAHAVILRVELEGDPTEGMKLLHDVVVPHTKSLAGFQRGMWMDDGQGHGTGVIVFDTEANATTAVPGVQPPPGGPKVIDCAAWEIVAEA